MIAKRVIFLLCAATALPFCIGGPVPKAAIAAELLPPKVLVGLFRSGTEENVVKRTWPSSNRIVFPSDEIIFPDFLSDEEEESESSSFSLTAKVQSEPPTAGYSGTPLPLSVLMVKEVRKPLSDILLFPDYSAGAARKTILKDHSAVYHIDAARKRENRKGISNFHLSKVNAPKCNADETMSEDGECVKVADF